MNTMTTFDEPQPQFDEAQSQFDKKLRHLAIEVQRLAPKSPQRLRALTELIQDIEKPYITNRLKGRLRKKYCLLSYGTYEDLFHEALQETLVAISHNIDRYDSQKSFIKWMSVILRNKFVDGSKKYSKKGITFIPTPKSKDKELRKQLLCVLFLYFSTPTASFTKVKSTRGSLFLRFFIFRYLCVIPDNDGEKQNEIQIISLDALEDFVAENLMSEHISNSENSSSSDCDLIRELLINDPDNIFKNSYVRGKPHANFQYIAIAIYVEGKNLQQLSIQLGIARPTLDSFFKRKLKRLEPYFREKLQP